MFNRKKLTAAVSVLLCVGFVACKKTTPVANVPDAPVAPVTNDRTQLTADSIFLYAKALYYWQADLPTYATFNPRQYTKPDDELYALSQLVINPNTGNPYEFVKDYREPKYSYIDYGASGGKKSALKSDLNGSANDYGFSATYNSVSDLRIKYVYPNSPADKAGLTRGCRVTSVNNRTDLNGNSAATISFLNDAIFGANPSILLTFVNLKGESKTATINVTNYTVNPILYTHVFTVGAKKVGYFVFNSFTNNVSAQINTAFADFASKGVSEMIVDLRYNGGGYVSTATQLVDLLAPKSQNGNTMFTFYYSQYLQDFTNKSIEEKKKSILAEQANLDSNGQIEKDSRAVNGKFYTLADLNYLPTDVDNITKFQTLQSTNVSRVYFLVSGSTASASELTINNLRAVTDVKLIGTTTYGKPVGFFPIHIDDFDMYIPEFETKNQLNVGGYYSGLNVDLTSSEDLTKNWGDSTETLLNYALSYAKNGNFNISPVKTGSLAQQTTKAAAKLSPEQLKSISLKLDQNAFKGMIRDRK